MDINIKIEANNIEDEYVESNIMLNKIKEEESELIIESDMQWLPIKLEDEQNNYYEEYCQEFGENINSYDYIKNEPGNEQYAIEYLDENEHYDDDDDDDNEGEKDQENERDDFYDPSEDVGEDSDSDNEDEEIDETDNEGNIDTEYNLQLEVFAEDMDKKDNVLEDNGSKTNILFPLKYWLFKTYVHHTCPECNEQNCNL
ncbi:ciliogenesis-associated TTC17-interacting protein-like [Lucilia cuprina]|uniref:ciliogenesis-associated TTC17-interacting protein-like n=1 Tax=Lucilia cuprina TaxID=7375 RepID=UPI001F0680B9|nr:ciliogenesis-associated TTC17-interacting protein-like [Lucilia cuprina]